MRNPSEKDVSVANLVATFCARTSMEEIVNGALFTKR